MAVPPESLQIRARVSVHSDFYRHLGRRIAALRRSDGLSQERLGERARVGSSYIAHIEIGSRKPTIDPEWMAELKRRVRRALADPGGGEAWDVVECRLAARVATR